MRYVTTNIRLPEDLWKSLKLDAALQGKRLSQIIRERVTAHRVKIKKKSSHKKASLCGLWRGFEISDSLMDKAQEAIFQKGIK